MDRLYSASEAARALGTTVPRLLRAVKRLGFATQRPHPGRGVALGLTESQVERLRRVLGTGTAPGELSRVGAQVLAALARSPRGVLSARSVARRAGVSPTAAARTLRRLVERGLVREQRELVALGRTREVDVYRANRVAPEWADLAADLARVRPPQTKRRSRPSRRVPQELRHLFWNTAPGQLDTERAGGYIARRLIQTDDLDGLAWGAEHLHADAWLHAAKTRGLAPDLRALACNLANAGR